MNNEYLSDLLIQANIKNENYMVLFYDSGWQGCPDTVRSTVTYIIFYEGVPIDHVTPVPGPVAKSGSESEYNSSCTAGIDLANFGMLICELLSKYPDIFPE